MGAITAKALAEGCGDGAFDAGIRIEAELEPVGGPGAPVKPAVYEGGRYQLDRRWEDPATDAPVQVVVIDNVPSQANRLEGALARHRDRLGCPELQLDLSGVTELPPHLPTTLSSFQFPHRNADAYLRDAQLEGSDFLASELGRGIFAATPREAAPLVAWFPQALLFGFWQSHLGKKRANTKHARAWVSEIIGWRPASTETRLMGLKGDPLNLSVDEGVDADGDDQQGWALTAKAAAKDGDRLAKVGHGQVPFTGDDAAPAGISFARITQTATVSFPQLRRISLADHTTPDADAAARALLVALGLAAHSLAFGTGFALRSGADLRPTRVTATWLGGDGDEALTLPDPAAAFTLVADAAEAARGAGVDLSGWDRDPVVLTPKENLATAIAKTWPLPA